MFGEMNFESSRAVADDEEEEGSTENQFGLAIEWTDEGAKYLEGVHPGAHLFTSFSGKVALGLGEGFQKSSKFTLLGEVFLTGNEGTIDLCSQRPKRKPCDKILLGSTPGSGNVILTLIDFYAVPRFLSNELVPQISKLISTASEVVIFHSEISVYNRSDEREDENGKLYYLASSKYPKLSKVVWLSPPNIVAGPSAAILTYCEITSKKGLMLIAYSETELVDSISLQPFFKVLANWNNVSKGAEDLMNLGKIFSQFQHNLHQFVDVSNLYA